MKLTTLTAEVRHSLVAGLLIASSLCTLIGCASDATKVSPDPSSRSARETAPLYDGINLAVQTHPSIASAEANARAAGAELRSSKLQRLPSFSVEGVMLDQTDDTAQLQAIVDQPLWTGGRISTTIDMASSRERAALASKAEAVLTVATSTAKAFFELHRHRERVAVLSLSLEQINNMVASMERRYRQEISPLSDLELARSRSFAVEQQLLQARAQEAAASSHLRELVGDSSMQSVGLPELPKDWPIFDDRVITAEVLSISPTLQRLRAEADEAHAEAMVARTQFIPQLSGQYTYSDAFSHRVGLVLKMQSGNGFSRVAEADAATQRAQASELQVTASQRQLRDQVFTLLREYESATARLDGSLAASGSTRQVMESYLRQFASGRRTWLDVMNAVREATAAELDALDVRISAQTSLVQIMLLSGEFVPDVADLAP